MTRHEQGGFRKGARTLYITDLDGTLLDSTGHVTETSRSLLNRAIADGALVSVATARTPATISTLIKGIDISLPMVVMTGAALWDMKKNRYYDVRFHRPETARKLLDIYIEENLPTFIYSLGEDHIIHIYHLGPMDELARQFMEERDKSPFKIFHVGADGSSDTLPPLDRVLLFLTMQPTEAARRVYERVCEAGDCRPIFYHDSYGDEIAELEVFAADASKAVGVREVAKIAGADSVVAFGDNMNDLPMLRAADHSVCVANAVEEVKATAAETIGPNTDDSVARYILNHTEKS